VGVIVVLAMAFFFGLLAKNYFGRMLIDTGNAFIANIPLLNKIYLGIQQILDSIVTTNKRLFDRAVLIEYPKKDSYCIGFVTAETRGEIPLRTQANMVSIFVPTTPNPTSGFLLFLVNPDQIRQTDHMYRIPTQLKKWNWLKILSRRKDQAFTADPRD
jgi:uncharacterized membrane protein